jgi:hypothetical protein
VADVEDGDGGESAAGVAERSLRRIVPTVLLAEVRVRKCLEE